MDYCRQRANGCSATDMAEIRLARHQEQGFQSGRLIESSCNWFCLVYYRLLEGSDWSVPKNQYSCIICVDDLSQKYVKLGRGMSETQGL